MFLLSSGHGVFARGLAAYLTFAIGTDAGGSIPYTWTTHLPWKHLVSGKAPAPFPSRPHFVFLGQLLGQQVDHLIFSPVSSLRDASVAMPHVAGFDLGWDANTGSMVFHGCSMALRSFREDLLRCQFA